MTEISINFADEKWVDFNSHEKEEDEEEALSLCDLPTNEEDEKDQTKKDEEQAAQSIQQNPQEDFEFGSWGGGSVFTESQMCNADEIFFQGQILPLRHSVSSDSALTGLRIDIRNLSRSVSRSESMDHFSTGGFTSVSSRSSSVSSTSTNNTIIPPPKGYKYKPVTRNQFHSHPSPMPQIRTPSFQRGNPAHSNQKSSMWSFLQVGLLKTPEIGLADLKVRSKNNTMKRFGSSNSTSSSCNSNSNSSNNVSNVENKNKDASEKKKKQRLFFETNGRIFGGCKCSVNTVESTIPSRIVLVKNSSTTVGVNEEGNLKEEREELLKKKTKQQNPGKQTMARHRTFEWLKQLSLREGEV